MSVRCNSDYRAARSAERRSRTSVWKDRLSSLPPPGPEERGSHWPTRSKRNRQAHVCEPLERGGRAEPGSLPPQESLLGRSPRLLRGNGAPRLPREDCEQETHDGHQAAVRGQVEQDLHRPCPGSLDEGRQARSPRSEERRVGK